jgi:hypothetical protein
MRLRSISGQRGMPYSVCVSGAETRLEQQARRVAGRQGALPLAR